MARKKSNDEQGVSMDSLMDALTNVVAVLIVILILLQVDVTQTVDKMLNDLKPASEEDINRANQELAQVQQQLARQTEMLKLPEPTAKDFGRVKAELSLLDEAIKKEQGSLVQLSQLRQEVEKQKKIEAEERQKTDPVITEINRIKGLLDQTPVPKAPPATVVRIPNSREIPKNAEILFCCIVGDQAHFVDLPEAKKLIMSEFKSNERQLLHSIRKIPKKVDIKVYDQDKIVQLFAQKNLRVRNQTITVPYNKQATRMYFILQFDPQKGDASLADMQQERGRFHNICARVRQSPRNVLIFKVHPNGFATYLKAREIADQMNVPCGWEIDGNSAHYAALDFEVNQLEKPAPPPPGAVPPPAEPKRKLD